MPVAAACVLAAAHGRGDEDVWLIRKVKQWYAPVLDRSLRASRAGRGIVTLLVTVPALVVCGLRIGCDFMPELDEGAFLLQTVLPAEASLDEVDRLNHRVEDVLRQVPEVEDVVRRTGRAERTEDPMPHTVSDVLVVLKPDRTREPRDELEAEMREPLEGCPASPSSFTTPLGMRIDEGLGGTPADLSVRIFGPDLDELARLAEQAARLMRGVDGIADLRAEQLTGLPQLRIAVDRAAAARVGLTPGDVIDAVRIGLVGEEASQIWIGQRRFDLVVRLRDDRRDRRRRDSHAADRRPRRHAHPARPARADRADVRPGRDPARGGQPAHRGRGVGQRAAISAAPRPRSAAGSDQTAASCHRLLLRRRRPGREPGARVTRARARDRRRRCSRVFVLLYLALGSVAEAAVILATLPIAFVGGIVALLLAGETWNVSSLVGLIGLFGIAVQNGLVLVTQTRGLLAEGRSLR